MNAAKSIFARSNFRLATTAQIAATAGISEPLIYRYFPSKKHLFLAALEDIAERVLRRWQRIRDAAPDALACLHRIGEDYLDLLDRNSDDLQVFFKAVSEDGDDEVRRTLAASYERYASYLESIIREGQAAGVIRRDVPARASAWEMVSLGAAFNLLTVLQVPSWTRADRNRQLLDFLERLNAQPSAHKPREGS